MNGGPTQDERTQTWCGGWGHRFDRRSVHGMRFDEQRFQCDVGRRFEQRHNRDIFRGRCQRFHPHRLRLRKQGSERGHRTGGQTIESVSDRRLHGVVGRYGRAAQQRPSRGQGLRCGLAGQQHVDHHGGYQARRQGPGLHVHHAGGVRREAKQG